MYPSVKNDDIDALLRQILLAKRNLKVVVLRLPDMDLATLTAHERSLVERHSSNEAMLLSLKNSGCIPPEFQPFSGTRAALIEILTPPEQYLLEGRLVLADRYGESVNIQGGARATTDQPADSAQTIFLVGGCRVYGFGAEDGATIASHLQRLISASTPFRIAVENCGQLYGGGGKKYLLFPHIAHLLATRVRDGDVLVIGGSFAPGKRMELFVDAQRYFAKPYKYGEVFFEERLPHLNANGNRLVADCLFDFLTAKKLLRGGPAVPPPAIAPANPVLRDEQFMKQLVEYQEYLAQFRKEGKCGGICMNANPFTNGHRFLVESASHAVDHLFILVAEENRSIFSFRQRFQLILEGTAEFSNVTVIRGGIFVGSFLTFPEYYDREVKKDLKLLPSLDIQVFVQHICPVLNITVRFIGTEPICAITNQYNGQLKAILPKSGIEVVEIPRKEAGEKVISASYVRQIVKKWKENEGDDADLPILRDLVPPSTLQFLQREFGIPPVEETP